MLTSIEKSDLKYLANLLESISETRTVSRRQMFKFLRKDLDYIKRSNPWMYGKMERGYSSEIKDLQLVEACRSLLRRG